MSLSLAATSCKKKKYFKDIKFLLCFSKSSTVAEKLSSVRMCVLQREIYFEWHFYGGTISHVVAFFMVAFVT